MPKKKIVQLRQSPREKSYIFDLQDDEVAMVTGAMGGCVSVIILWGISGGRFSHVRGHHGSGGIDAVDWDSLKAGVPKNDPTVLVVVAYAPGETSYGIEKIRGEVSKKTAGTRRVFAEHSNCYVDRSAPIPTIRQYEGAENSNYRIRGGGSAVL